ncbi:MAG: glycosyltransferase family 4 protein [Actinobacteria bacterium]|nr:glycosyltransferase family 4 protein [Actinomycetota bacterium]
MSGATIPPSSEQPRRPAVACVSLDPTGEGGMAEVLRSLLASPLAEQYRMRMIVTYALVSPPRRLFRFAAALVELAAWCLGSGPRLVHIQGAVRGSLYRKSLCVFLARALRRPVLFQIHAGPGDIEDFVARLDPVRRAVFATALRRSTRTVAVSSESARAVERCFGVAHVGVLPNPVPPVAGGGVDVGADPGRVLYLGGFSDPAKGGATLVEAIGSLAVERPADRFELFGPGEPPAALLDLAGRAENVRWGGWLDAAAKEDAFRAATVFVLPSISEGLPMALLEAMAWGRSIVASAMGGVLDLIADGEDGLLAPPGDAPALAGALRRLLGDPGLRRRLAEAAERRAAEFSEAAVWGRLDALYQELAA